MRLFGFELSARRRESRAAARALACAYGGGRLPDARTTESQYASLEGGVSAWRSLWGSLTPTVEQRIIEFMSWGGYVDPQLSQGRKFIKHLGATRPTWEFPATWNETAQRKSLAIIGGLDNRLRGGLTKLTYSLFDQILTAGAHSFEALISTDRRNIAAVELIPAAGIRFRMIEGRWTAHQRRSSGQEVKIESPTYYYMPFEEMEGSPYGIPPFLAAGGPILKRFKAEENILFILDKFGLLGLTLCKMAAPDGYVYGDSPDTDAKVAAMLEQRISDLNRNFKKGLLVTLNDAEYQMFNPSEGGGRGSEKLYDLISDLGWGGMGPGLNSMLGSAPPRETFANVIYRFLTEEVRSFQEYAAMAMVFLVTLEHALQGIDATGIRCVYPSLPSFDVQAEAQARNFDVQSELASARAGLISADEAAMRLYGHPADDPEKLLASQAAGSPF